MKKFLFLVSALLVVLASCSKTDLGSITPDVVATTATTIVTDPSLGGPPPPGDPISVDSLPKAIKDSISRFFPGYVILKAERKVKNGVTIYEVKISNGTVTKELYYAATGQLLGEEIHGSGGDDDDDDHNGNGNHNDSNISLDSLPRVIKDSVARFYVSYTILKAEREVKNGATTYEVTVRNGTITRELTYSATGQLLRDKVKGSGGNSNGGGNILVSAIPQTALTYMSTNYAGYTIQEAEREVKNGVTTYEVKIKNGSLKKTLIFDSNWVFLREKR